MTAKGDKKKKKEVAIEIARLEEALDEKHRKELLQLQKKTTHPKDHQNKNSSEEDVQKLYSQERISKAQKRRDKKEKKEKDREEMIAAEEIRNLTGVRNLENQKIKEILKSRDLMVYEIPSDGDCMYRAVENQLKQRGVETNVTSLRKRTAEYIRSNADDFLPFLIGTNSTDLMTPEEFERYCDEIENAHAWGGEAELKSLSRFLELPIHVVQATGPSIVIGECDAPHLTLSYHRHAYGLGEHYNSVVPFREEKEDF